MPAVGTAEKVFTQCPGCRSILRVPVRLVGHDARCPHCSKSFRAAVYDRPPTADSRHVDDERIGTQVGDYLITGVLGRGGMGAVYEAVDLTDNRTVALKILPPEMVAQGQEHLQRFLREGRYAAELHHPNIVNIVKVGCSHHIYFIAMEVVRGGTAQAFLRSHGKPMSPKAATRIIKEAAKGLAAVHRHGIVHRDVKPSNLMLGEHGLVKLGDFGLAKGVGSEISVTKAGGVIGTPSYMSPEQVRGAPVDHRSDLYSLGCTFYTLLVGRPPFNAESAASVMYKHLNEPPPDPRRERGDVPEAVTRVIARLMAKDPDDRYDSADDLISDLDRINFRTADAGHSDQAMTAWLKEVAKVQDGTVSDPSIYWKRRMQRLGRFFRGLGVSVRDFAAGHWGKLVVGGVVLVVLLIGLSMLPMVRRQAEEFWRRLFG
jgi:serine/threonine protein kinase